MPRAFAGWVYGVLARGSEVIGCRVGWPETRAKHRVCRSSGCSTWNNDATEGLAGLERSRRMTTNVVAPRNATGGARAQLSVALQSALRGPGISIDPTSRATLQAAVLSGVRVEVTSQWGSRSARPTDWRPRDRAEWARQLLKRCPSCAGSTWNITVAGVGAPEIIIQSRPAGGAAVKRRGGLRRIAGVSDTAGRRRLAGRRDWGF